MDYASELKRQGTVTFHDLLVWARTYCASARMCAARVRRSARCQRGRALVAGSGRRGQTGAPGRLACRPSVHASAFHANPPTLALSSRPKHCHPDRSIAIPTEALSSRPKHCHPDRSIVIPTEVEGSASAPRLLDWLERLQQTTYYDAESAVPESDEDAIRLLIANHLTRSVEARCGDWGPDCARAVRQTRSPRGSQ
jgi:hypothetical protein